MRYRFQKLIESIKDVFIKPGYEEIIRRKSRDDYRFLSGLGVETCPGYVTLIGKPQIMKVEGARIILGKRVTLVSDNYSNQAGINHHVILCAEAPGAVIELKDGVGMSGGCISTRTSVVVGEDTMLGANVNIFGEDFHPIESDKRLSNSTDVPSKPVVIGERCFIGANATVLKGVTIGDEAVIGTMSLVSKDVPDKVIAVGNPARVIKTV